MTHKWPQTLLDSALCFAFVSHSALQPSKLVLLLCVCSPLLLMTSCAPTSIFAHLNYFVGVCCITVSIVNDFRGNKCGVRVTIGFNSIWSWYLRSGLTSSQKRSFSAVGCDKRGQRPFRRWLWFERFNWLNVLYSWWLQLGVTGRQERQLQRRLWCGWGARCGQPCPRLARKFLQQASMGTEDSLISWRSCNKYIGRWTIISCRGHFVTCRGAAMKHNCLQGKKKFTNIFSRYFWLHKSVK